VVTVPTISSFKYIATDNRLLGPFIVSVTANTLVRNTAAAREEEVLTRGLLATSTAKLDKLNAGLNTVRAEIDSIDAQEVPSVRTSELVSALTAGLAAIDELSIKTTARTSRKQFLNDALTCGFKIVRPVLNLTSLKAEAEWATAAAELSACVALESAHEAYEAGAALRNVEGRAELFAPNGKTAKLLAEARQAFGIANSYSIAYSDEQRRLEKGTKNE
jgi:hypothetical protein